VDLEQRLREGPLRIRDVWSPDRSEQLAGKVVRLRRRRSLARAAVALSATLCALLGVIFAREAFDGTAPSLLGSASLLARATDPGALARSSAGSIGGIEHEGEQVLVLHDGSRAEPAGAGSRLTLERDRPEHVSVRLQRGAARFAVVRNPTRRFEVESGPVLVRVIGTTFTVTRTGDGARVAVEDGRVHVYWAGQQAVLTAGESGVFPRPADVLAAVVEPAPHATKHAPAGGSAPGWRDLARRGEYRKAYSALHREPARLRDLPEDHMLAADVARLSGHPDQAVPHLRAVADRFASDPRAPVAAFTLGRVLLGTGRAREAAAAFMRARSLWPRGPLALDAWASEAEARQAAGELRAARKLALRYLQRHPGGRHAPAMRALAASN
jgi:transmembrane sensor